MDNLLLSETALLGLLTEDDMHPYQIEKTVRERCMREWTELSQSAIYKLLIRLEKAGLVKNVRKVSKENRVRKIYSITRAGRKTLKKKAAEVLSEPEQMKWRVDIAVYNSGLLDSKERIACLKSYRNGLKKKIQEYRELYDFMDQKGCTTLKKEVALRPVFLLEGEIKWVNLLIAKKQVK